MTSGGESPTELPDLTVAEGRGCRPGLPWPSCLGDAESETTVDGQHRSRGPL
jgi:hypothetical protein